MKRTLAGMAVVAALTASATPIVSNVRVAQSESRLVTVNYALAGAPAVVTMNVQTNAGDGAWIDIGGEHVWSLHHDTWSPAGDVFRRVEADGEHAFTWRPDRSWPDLKLAAGATRIVVTAWAPEDAPDYMSIELRQNGDVGYYPSADYVPGGVLSNEAYRTTSLLLRRIHARGVPWTMGNQFESDRRADREDVHTVTLTNDYYLGVFEITQRQWTSVGANLRHTIVDLHDMRPMTYVSYDDIRDRGNAANAWPAEPGQDSWLDRARKMVGLALELPSEAEWEFACRAGMPEGYWGSGTRYGNGYEGRYDRNRGDETTAICGSYRPNRFGLYDMHGNVLEWCLDWGRLDISALNGAVNVEQDAHSDVRGKRIIRGGGWSMASSFMRSSFRAWNFPNYQVDSYGFRVACRAGLK